MSGQAKIVLFDNRENSSTYKQTIEFVSSDKVEPIGYFFPPGVFHGYKCTKGPMHIIYITSGIYDLNNEIRKTSQELNINLSF